MLQSVTKLVLTVRSKGAFWHFTDFQRGKYSFSSPIPSMQHCAAVQATLAVENNKHRNFEWRGGERGVDSFVLCSYPIWVHVSTILLPIVWIAKWPYMLKKTNSTHLFSLGYKTLGGTFFCYDWCNHAYFKTLLEYGYFIIFSVTWQFHVTLNMPWHHAMWRVPQNFLFFPLSKQGTPKVKKTENKIVADSFVLFSYPIWVHWCPNSFVADIRSAIT